MTMGTRYLSIALLAALVIGPAISCGSKNTEANALVDPIKIDTGYVSGTLIGNVGKEVRIYRGIPYAAPPVGELRWKPPQPAAPWPGIRECTAFGKSSPQPTTLHFMNELWRVMKPTAFGKSSPQPTTPIDLGAPQSEDCLYLNVLTPAKKASDNLPVMVWLHGGGYTTGSGSSSLINLPRLPQNGVVLVTVNMRLGPMGLLAHPLLSKESPKGISGNYMFFDMIAALEWVQRNIAVFGGNPKNVTIFGESGGGGKVNCLIASPLAKGLFHRGILESAAMPGPVATVPIKDLESIGEKLFAKLGIDKESDPLKAARALPPEKIMEAGDSLSKELNKASWLLWDAAIDGQFLVDAPRNIFRAGKQNPVPVITSATLGELMGPGMLVVPFLVPEYVNILKGVNAAGQKGYACIFDQVPSKWRQEGCVSVHGMEISYVFGDWDDSTRWLPVFFNLLAKEGGAKTPDPGLTDADRKVSENMMAMWAQFARTGNPNINGQNTWPTYSSETDQYLYIAEPLQVKSGFSKVAQKQ